MPNYYRASNPSDLRDIPQEWIDGLTASNNPKKDEWVLAPENPSENHVWQNGEWVEPAITNADAVPFLAPHVPEGM
jgi:hypothetical protein